MLTAADFAYVAGVVDTVGRLRLRRVQRTMLPLLVVQGRWSDMIDHLCSLTGSSPTDIEKSYYRHNCTDHCPDKHQEILSRATKWELVGARATVVLYNILPYMVIQREQAQELLSAGLQAGWKGHAVVAMSNRGWVIPELKTQERSRIIPIDKQRTAG